MKIHDLSYCRDVAENIVGGCPFYHNTEINPDVEVNLNPSITVDPDGEPAINENIDIHFPTDLVNTDFINAVVSGRIITDLPPELSALVIVGELTEVPTYVHWPDVY